jgi:hypothetical protein
MMIELLAWFVAANVVALDNEYVVVTRDAAPFAAAHAGFAERVIVALGDIELTASGTRKKLVRGDVAVFPADEEYEPPTSGSFFEVAIRSAHPPVQSPPEIIAPEKNAMRYDGAGFFVFEEKLAPGETRARHSHSQRVVMQLNRTKLQQWPDNAAPVLVETIPERVSFNPPVIHVVKNVGEVPLRGIIIEFKSQPASR